MFNTEFKKKKIWNNQTINVSNLIKIQKWFIESKSKSNIFTLLIWIISVIFIVFVWIWFLNQVSSTKFDFNSIFKIVWFDLKFDDITQNKNILKANWKTNILIIWRWWKENDAPDLTDSIILASINYDKKMVSMFSIPRDLYIDYPTWYKWRINEAYLRGIKKTWNKLDWIDSLKKVVKKITWEDTHYYINLDFAWFREIIDTIWWIDIDVPEAIVDTTYPWPNDTYQTFRISAWPQTLDWANALKYARSRHTTSDFDRSLRQQLIVKAIREKVLSLWMLSSPSKIKWLYSVVKKHLETDLDATQIIALAMYLKELPKENIVSSNLNDTCFYGSSVCEKWWFLIVPDRSQFGWAAILLQEWWSYNDLSNYESIEKYTNLVFNYPHVYTENLKINIFNATKVSWLANIVADSLKKYWFNIPSKNSVGNTSWEKYLKSQILYTTWSWWVKPETVEALEQFIFGWSQKVEKLPKYSKENDVKIEIIIWDDYKLLNF